MKEKIDIGKLPNNNDKYTKIKDRNKEVNKKQNVKTIEKIGKELEEELKINPIEEASKEINKKVEISETRNENIYQISNSKKLKKELYFKILILIILILLVGITSFRTGRKFYLLSNTYFGNTCGIVDTEVCKWNFKAKIIIGNEVIYGK